MLISIILLMNQNSNQWKSLFDLIVVECLSGSLVGKTSNSHQELSVRKRCQFASLFPEYNHMLKLVLIKNVKKLSIFVLEKCLIIF